jgi:alpha/beta superfamily hydrolase
MEEEIRFKSGDLALEGLLDRAAGSRGVVVTHPHPLYGGAMRNNVVSTLVQAYGEAGYSTLRFNFRGVGASQGRYDNGAGEQEDVRAALDYLFAMGCVNLDLAGYSFGAWVNAMGQELYPEVLQHLCLISPPVAFMDFSTLAYSPRIRMVISGSLDDIAPPSLIREMIGRWNPEAKFRVVEGADHFYSGYETELLKIMNGFLRDQAE